MIGESERGESECGESECGEGAIEAAIFGLVLVLLILFATLAGRLGATQGDVESAARDAARAASLAGSPSSARAAGQASGTASLAERDISCSGGGHVAVDVAGFAAGGTVSATVTCQVRLSDLGLLGVPGSRSVTARSIEVVDTFRGGD